MTDDVKKGLMGIVVDETTISQVMPGINSLTYRGYKVQDLCEKCIFEEVAYLVLNGELPRSKDLKKFINEERSNRKLSKQIFEAGEKVDEKVWRLPLHKNYDKLMDSKTADIQNINYVGGAGSTTAAQFLQRFIINKTPWAHLDIAGMAFSKMAGNLNPGGATGYGVRLLNQFVEDNYE